MDHYLEIQVMADPEFSEEMLMAALFSKLHRALVACSQGDIGISLPRAGVKPGAVLRLHGSNSALQALESAGWRKGLNDYCQSTAIMPLPPQVQWRTVSRVQVKSSPERLLRRSVRKGWLTEEQALQRSQVQKPEHSDLPFIHLKSASTGQLFRLFILQGAIQSHPVPGRFNSYGLSQQATIPWF